jgi:multicomponent Na+:H+ antiporter subunit G
MRRRTLLTILDWASLTLTLLGGMFFFAGTLGLLRFPDVFTRLHALTKAYNVGLGLMTAGLVLEADSVAVGLKLLVIWLLALLASATTCHLIARAALRGGIRPWSRG